MWVTQRPRADGPTVAGALVSGSWLVFGVLTVLCGLARVAGTLPSLRVQSLAYLALMLGVSGEQFQAEYVAGYLLLIAGSLAVFLVAPVAGLGLALAVTALKGGHGGVRVLETLTGTDHLRERLPRAVAVAVRGGAIIVVPYLVSPGEYYMVASYMVSIVEPGGLAGLYPLVELPVRAAVGGVYGALVVGHLAGGWARVGDTRGWRADAAETLLLVGFFAAVPPILAIGVYFPCWYATRQVARLSGAAGNGRALSGTAVTGALSRFLRRAALPWLGALAVLVGMAGVVPHPPVGAVTWMAFYSVFVSVIAVPHVVVGGWLDRRQGIWSVAGDSPVEG
jgi:Brp/Blh family beta-carotene 15,15'-monooxygenase